MREGFHILEHPADVGIEAVGPTVKDAFKYAALGLISLIVEPSSVDPIEQRYIKLGARDREQLLVKWLSEILYLCDAENFLVSDVSIEIISDEFIEAIVTGDLIDERKHPLKLDVKAITYHQLRIDVLPDGCKIRVFVDV